MAVYPDEYSVLIKARGIVGSTLKLIDKKGILSTGKGAIGNLVQENWFGIAVNNNPSPDFEQAGIELKVTPFIIKARQKRAKERLVCNMIDFMKEYGQKFETSSFWLKCRKMLILTYEHNSLIPKGDYVIDDAFIFNFPIVDKAIIKKDWEMIIKKIQEGRAHEISEADTMYLGACTKARDSSVLRQQPFSTTLAKPRAFALKQSYVDRILTDYVYGVGQNPYVIREIRGDDNQKLDTENREHVIKSIEEFENNGFEGYLGPAEKSDSRYGRSFKQLLVLFQPILQSNLRSSARAKKELKGSAAGAQRSLPG